MHRFLKRLRVAGAMAVLLALGLSGTSASAATVSGGLNSHADTSSKTTAVLKVRMALDCAHMSAKAHTYAVAHHYCSGISAEGISPENTTPPGNCGISFIYLYDDADGGGAHINYGFESSLGTVVYRALSVGWYNNTDGTPGGFSDNHAMFSSTYDVDPPVYTHTGLVTAWLSGSVVLWWGGTCTLLNPSDVLEIT